jgi:hypothetical protein
MRVGISCLFRVGEGIAGLEKASTAFVTFQFFSLGVEKSRMARLP